MSATSTRRIVIGFDSSRQTLAALEAAAELAAQLNAELVGVFVEDDNLLRLAALPCSSEVGFATAKARNLNLETIERTFRHMADEARRAMAQVAERRHIRWSFSSARGSVIGRLLESVSGESTAKGRRGQAACAGVGSSPHSVLLMQIGACCVPRGKSVIVVDGHYSSVRKLPTALALAEQACTVDTLILVIAETTFEARRQQERVTEVLEAEETTANVRAVMAMGLDDLLYFLKNEDCGTLILSGVGALFDRDTFAHLVERTEFPIFVVS